jgi:CDP-glucose 4,6-dehydratase
MTGKLKDKKILVTGGAGFIGSNLCEYFLKNNEVVCLDNLSTGYMKNMDDYIDHPKFTFIEGDIRDAEKLTQAIQVSNADIVFHLAAQSLVRRSYKEPVETFSTNVMGTLNVYEACRNNGSVKAIINVTSDKCYENKEWTRGYCETDPMGGYDPYSCSKGCSELLTKSYRKSYFNKSTYGVKHETLLASCRAGNVIGGGDWAEDRILPDIMRAISKNESVSIRNPAATRPWQHVLESLGGYLLLGAKMMNAKDGELSKYCTSFNFGPYSYSNKTVETLVNEVLLHAVLLILQSLLSLKK